MWKLALFALLFARLAIADTAQNLQVTMTIPWYGSTPTDNVTTSFDWTGTTLSNIAASGGFALDSQVEFDPASNGILAMFWTGPTGSFQQDSEYNMGTDLEILPAPWTYPMMIFESCGGLCNGLRLLP